MNAAVLTWCWLVAASSTPPAPVSPVPAPAMAAPPAAPAPNPPVPQPPAPASTDSDPPLIRDVAVAATDPATAPVVSADVVDIGSGVARVTVSFRAFGSTTWVTQALQGSAGGLYLVRLPEGLQKTGFDYYLEATDVAGNAPAAIGSAESPVAVAAAVESTPALMARVAEEKGAPPPGIHPAWVMLALGTGVVGSAVSAGFWLDFATSTTGLDAVNARLDESGLSAARRAALEADAKVWRDAQLSDSIIGTVAGVIGVAGLATGIALFVVSAAEQPVDAQP